MKPETIDTLWSVSRVVMIVATVVVAAGWFIDLPVPDVVIRVFGVIDIVSIVVFTYASVKRNQRYKS